MAHPIHSPARVVVMGVSGSGKTTLAQALAQRLDARFIDADDHHPPANLAKMAAGQPLTDADRLPWLDTLARLLTDPDRPVVLACSALRQAYRDRLQHPDRPPDHPVIFLWLDVPEPVLLQRMQSRDHFMPPALLTSQLATLEPPGHNEPVIRLDGTRPLDELTQLALQYLQTQPQPPGNPQP